MNRERAKELLPIIEHYANGGDIEVKSPGCPWGTAGTETGFSDRWQYRIKETPDSIDWSHVAPEYNWVARDRNGKVWVYVDEPRARPDDWCLASGPYGNHVRASSFASYKRGTTTWDNSLITRPEGE